MDEDTLFIEIMNRLDLVATDGEDPYAILQSSGQLRLLLLDGFLHKVNRTRKLEIRFRAVNAFATPYRQHVLKTGPAFMTVLNALIKDSSGQGVPEQMPLDRFLSLPVMFVEGRFISVREIITYAANVAGGVHFGDPKSSEGGHHSLHSIQEFNVGGHEVHAAQLLPIMRIVHKSLHELYERVRADLSSR